MSTAFKVLLMPAQISEFTGLCERRIVERL